jgi:hypothetical protein
MFDFHRVENAPVAVDAYEVVALFDELAERQLRIIRRSHASLLWGVGRWRSCAGARLKINKD